jgi:hypothetical protein
MIRDNSVAYMDIDTGKSYHTRIVRSGCNNDLMAADGLLSVPGGAGGCVCNYPIQTSFAMIHMPEVEVWSGTTPLPLEPPPALPAMESGIERIQGKGPR